MRKRGYKKCRTCKLVKSINEYNISSGLTKHLKNNCKMCEKFSPIVTDDEKYCRGCRIVKSKSDFSKYISNTDGLSLRCKNCSKLYRDTNGKKEERKEYCRKWYKDNIEKSKTDSVYGKLKHIIDISKEEYVKKLEESNGICKICGGKEDVYSRLSLDHCHETGMFRGLLCHRCNTILGMAGDNINILKEAIQYLEEFNNRKYN